MDKIKENDYALLKLPSGNYKIIRVEKGPTVDLGKFGKFKSELLIGQWWGRNLIIDDQKLLKANDFLVEYAIDFKKETSANNQNLHDRQSAQTLKQEEIEAMKKTLDGSQIIASLVANSETYQERTEFSKAKYIKKKLRKFTKGFCPIQPTAESLCEYYFEKNFEKIRELRIDTLSQMLSCGNVRAGSRLLVCDDTSGLLGTAIMERTHGIGDFYFIHDGHGANLDLMRISGHKNYTAYPWSRFNNELVFNIPSEEQGPEAIEKSKIKFDRLVKEHENLMKGGFDGLIIASKFNVKSVVDRLLPFLKYSAKIVCYSPQKEMMLDCYSYVRTSKNFVNTQMTESWMREYQVPVLASGTHPNMTTSGTGGFLFCATKVKCPLNTGGIIEENQSTKKQKTD